MKDIQGFKIPALLNIRDLSLSDQGEHVRIEDVTINSLLNETTENSTLVMSNKDSEMHCNTGDLMGPLGLFIQALLAFIAFTSLIVKRFCEPHYTRRPWKIWFFDTSKQGFGAAAIHFANVFLADMFHGDPCTWYIISFLLDSTIGILIIYIGLKITQIIVRRKKWDTLKFGEYGTPPQCSAWIGQCGLYILVMVIEKILTTLLVLFQFWKDVREFIMSPIKDPHVELIIVMFVVPLVVNAIIFWVVDNFLKKKVLKWKSGVTNPIDTASVQYTKITDKVTYYTRGDKVSESESDILLSLDEDSDHTRTRNGRLRSPSGSKVYENNSGS